MVKFAVEDNSFYATVKKPVLNCSCFLFVGYAMSYSTLKRFVEEKFPDVNSCEAGGKYWKNGDWYLGRHLNELGINPMDTRDHAGLYFLKEHLYMMSRN